MTQIIVLPHVELCPEGAVVDVPAGTSILDGLLANGIEVEHACEKSCACTTCHVIVREGFEGLAPASDREEDMLDNAPCLTPRSRLGCQIEVNRDLVVEIPPMTRNMVSEEH